MPGRLAASDSNPRLTSAQERVVSALFAAGTRPLSLRFESSIIRLNSIDYSGEAFSHGVDFHFNSHGNFRQHVLSVFFSFLLLNP